MKTFTLKKEHLTLVKNLHVVNGYTKGLVTENIDLNFTVDFEKIYYAKTIDDWGRIVSTGGDRSRAAQIIYNILDNSEFEEVRAKSKLSQYSEDELYPIALLKDLDTTVEVILQTFSFQPGYFVKENDKWERIE